MDDFDDIPVIEDDSDDLETLDFSDDDLAEFSDDQDNPLDTGAEFSGQETTEVDGEEIILEIPDAEVNLDIFSSMSDDPDLQDVDELDETSTAVAETIEEYDNTAVIPTIGAVTAGERVMVVLKNGVPIAMGSTGFGDDINLRVHEIEADYIKAETIEAERVRVDNLLANKADISSLTAEQIRVDNLLAGKASVSDLSAATGRIDDLEADHVSVDDLEAANGKITNLETNALTANSAVIQDIQAETAKVENLTAESLSAATGYIAALKSASIEASDISADHATIAAIDSDYIKTSDLEAERAAIDNLLAEKADISDLTAATGRIDDLEADHVSTDDLEAEQIRVDNLLAAKASVSDLSAEQIRVNNLLADKADISTLEAEYAHVTNGTIDNAKINHADVTGLNAEVANIADARISQATITQAQVQNLSADYAKITNGKINSALIDVAAIVDEQVFTVTGNKATIEEINADTITVRNLHTANLVVDSAEGYVTIGNKRTPTKEALDSLIGTLQQEIDGAVETFTSSAVPLLSNYPASDWQISGATAEEQRKAYAKHVGDICYVQNTASAQNGYAYRFAYDSTEQTFKWVLIKDSDVTKALGDISDLQTFESETNTWIEETDEGLRTIRENHTTLSGVVDKTMINSTQLWFSKANTTAPNKPTAEVTSTSTAGNAWRTVVPAYNASYPNYFYCYQWEYADGTFGWSAVTRDIAMGESQAQARKGVSDAAAASNKATTAQNTANANIKSSVQLWFTKTTNAAPSKPSSVISTNNASTANAWNLAVPTYNASYPHYFYCYQQQKGDGTYQWTDVVYDRATTENQAVARAALPSSTFETFRTTTFKEIVDTVDEQSTSITTLTEKTSTLANPNLTPWFSAQNSVYWNTGFSVDYDYATGHGHRSSTEGSKDVTYLNDGWTHVILDSRASAGNENKSCYINTWVNRNQLGDITPGGTYTWLIEVRNLSITKDTLRVRPSMGHDTLDIFSAVPVNTTDSGCEFSEDGVKWIQVTAKSDLSNVTCDTRGYIYVITDVYAEADVRVSLYEGEYSGPYKPYIERLENITEISNTVNTVRQTADTNTASITNLTKTVSDNKTSIEQLASTIEQNLSGITTRVSKTESDLETVSNPNLSPFFSNQLSDIYNAETNPDGYWGNDLTGGNTKLSDGWTHYEFSNTASSTRWLTIYEHCAWRHANGDLKGDTDYTVLMEFRNVTKTGNVTASGITTHTTSWRSMFRNTIDAQAITEGAELYFTGKTVSDPSAITGNSVSTRTLLSIPAGASISCDFRVSLYEGEYSGPYKPYVDQSLISRISTAETSIKQHDDEIELRATKTELAKETRQRKGTYAECTTAAATANKVATISPAVSDFELYPGVTVAVCFTTGNNVASPKLNVNNTGLYPIVVTGTAAPALEAVKWSAWTTAMFTFDIRNQWRLVSTDEDVRRLTNAETKIEQNANAITLRATKVEMGQMNLSPFFQSVPFGVSSDNPYWVSNFTTNAFTALDDGWAHFHRDNTAGTSVSSNYVRMVKCPSVVDGDEYTCLVEIRNIVTNTATSHTIYTQQSTEAQFWGSNSYDGWQLANAALEEKAYYFSCTARGVSAHSTSGKHLMYINWQVPAGAEIECDIRISLYAGEYEGPYKPYTGSQLYASQAQLKVANDAISLRVEKGDVINQINVSSESAKIQASKVEINGTAVFSAIEDQLNNAYDVKGAASTAETNAKAYTDSVEIGGRNLLPTTEKLSGFTTNTATISIVDGVATFPGTSTAWTYLHTPNIPFSAVDGNDITFSFEYKSDIAVYGYITTEGTANNDDTRTKYKDHTLNWPAQSEWTKWSVTFKGMSLAYLSQGSGNVNYFHLGIYDRTDSSNFKIRFPKLEKGSKATDWTPAPEDVDASIATVEQGLGGFDILWNRAEFAADTNAGGECYLCAYDPTTATRSDANGWAMWNGTKRTITKGMFNPNKILPYNIPIYIVCRLSSATATTGTNYMVWYDTDNSKWRSGPMSPAASTLADWTWAETTDMILGKFVEPGSEVAFTECETYRQPLKWGSITTDTVTARSANAAASAAQTTANNAAPKANAIARSQRIYYRATSASGKPAKNETWLAASGTGYGNWSLNIPKLTLVSGSTETKYPFLYTAVQTQTVAQQAAGTTCSCTTVLIDETTTVIDGATIITGSVHANVIDANSGTFAEANIPNLSASKIQASVINAVNNGTGTINADKINVSAIKIGDLSGSIGGRNYAKTNFAKYPIGKSETRQSNVTATIKGPSTIILNGSSETTDWFFSSADVFGGLVLEPGTYKLWYTSPNVGVRVGIGTNGATWFFANGACSKASPATMTVTTEQAYYFTPFANTGATFNNQEARLMVEKGDRPTDWTPAPEDQMTYIDNSVNSIQIGGRNLLRDSTFTAALGTYWVIDGLTASISNSSLVIDGASASGNKRIYQGLAYFKHEAGITYTVSCDIVSTAACKISFGRRYSTVDEGGVTFDVTTTKKRVSGTYQTIAAAFCIGQPTNNATVTISNIKLEIGNKATDWSPAPEDVTALAKAFADSAEENAKDEIAATRSWYATCSTAAGTAEKAATISPATTEFTNDILTPGTVVRVKFTVTNSAGVSNIKLSVNGTTAYPIRTIRANALNAIISTDFIKANVTYTFFFDGTYWVVNGNDSDTGAITNALRRQQYYNSLFAKTDITAGRIIVGNISGYRLLTEGVAFDLSYPILYAAGSIAVNHRGSNNFLVFPDITATTVCGVSSITGLGIDKTLYLIGTVTGNTFTVTTGNYVTATVPSTKNGLCYIPLGITYSATKFGFVSSSQLYAYVDGSFGPVSIREASAAAKTATTYLTDITGGGVKVHPSGSDTTGVWITSNVDIMRAGSSVAMFGTDENDQPISRIGYEDSGHTEQTSDAFTIYADHPTEGLSVAAEFSTGSEELNGLTYRTNKLNLSTPNGPAYLETIERSSLGSQLKLWINDTINTWPSLLLGLSTVISNQTRTARIEFAVEDEGATELNLYADYISVGAIQGLSLPNNAVSSNEIESLAASKITGTLDAAQIPNLDASKITGGVLNAARIPNHSTDKLTTGILPIARGGTGDSAVETVTAQATIFTSVTSGMTISSLTCATWGKMCMLSFVVKPSAAQTSAFVIGTLATDYRPVAACTANPYHSSVGTARILTNGTIQMTAAPANEIPVSFTYLLA